MDPQRFGGFVAEELAHLNSAKLYNWRTSLTTAFIYHYRLQDRQRRRTKQNLKSLNAETLSKEATTTCQHSKKTLAMMH